jgi:hypothetical protein
LKKCTRPDKIPNFITKHCSKILFLFYVTDIYGVCCRLCYNLQCRTFDSLVFLLYFYLYFFYYTILFPTF